MTLLKKLVIFAVLILAADVSASDSSRTVREVGHRVFINLGIVDTLEGSARLDSIRAQKCARDAAIDVGALIPTEYAKTIVTEKDGTLGYLVDTHLDSLQGCISKRNKKATLIDVVSWWKFMEALKNESSSSTSGGIRYAALHGDSVYFYPPPAIEDTIYLFFTARGTVPTTYSSVIDVPHELCSAVEYLATVKAAAILVDDVKLGIYKQMYADEVSKFIGGKRPQ